MRRVSVLLPFYNRLPLLRATLDSFQHFYRSRDLEVVVVDDASDPQHRVEGLVGKYDFDLRVVRIGEKSGVNPCYPYNVGARAASGDVLVLSSPETVHTADMYRISEDFTRLDHATYLQFSVFCLTDSRLRSLLLGDSPFPDKLSGLEAHKREFYANLGEFGYPYNNRYGSWYTHSGIRPTCLNFFSALTRKTYFSLSGFDERFRYGTGYDDEEFKIRVLASGIRPVWLDEAVAIHVDHEVVGGLSPTTNFPVFERTRSDVYKHNDQWGLL